jgi:hypothetical protein
LDPANLTPAASLNRVRFTELWGFQIPTRMVDWAAYALLSAKALSDLRARSGSEDEAARRFGERLGWLLVTLRLGDPASRAARPDWDESYWQHWAAITTVFLGGGVASSELGAKIAEQAARTLAEAGMGDCAVQVAPWPEHLPMIGAARTVTDVPPTGVSPGVSSAVVFDFGHSYVKRALARYQDGALNELRLLPRLPARLPEIPSGADPTPEQTHSLGERMVATMAETWRAARIFDEAVSPTIVASLASYMRDGQPLARQGGGYAYLLSLSENLADWLAERLTDTLGREITVRLLHDGTAAAMSVSGEPTTAVIMMGTSLGVGFPPADAPGCAISRGFAVTGTSAGR